MKKESQSGESFIGSLGLFFLFACSCAAIIYFLSIKKHERKIDKTVAGVTDFFQHYHEYLPEFVKQHTNITGSTFLVKYGVFPNCRERESVFDAQKKVCKLSLLEL